MAWTRLGGRRPRSTATASCRALENLARFPKMVRERSEFTPPLRVHHHGRHYIAYTIEGGSVLILRIVRDEADLDYLFGS